LHGIWPINGADWLFILLLPPFAFFLACAAFNLRLVLAGFSPQRTWRNTEESTKDTKFAGEERIWTAPKVRPLLHEEKRRVYPQIGTDYHRLKPGEEKEDEYRFLVLIPAHNEELLLAETLQSVADLDYPRESYDVLVIADNCTDRTAEIAREHDAIVLERHDAAHIGKGHALNYALSSLPSLCASSVSLWLCGSNCSSSSLSAVVLLDADTLVAPNLLRAFADGLARGERVMQAAYLVRNPDANWRTRLMTCALALIHVAKPLGRERLHLSDGLKGNGMCFTRDIAARIPWNGDALAEDLDYTFRLVREGVRVAFRADTAVYAAMPGSARSAATQRRRWEMGRWQVVGKAPALLLEGIRTRNRLLTDRALELLVPPFAERFAAPALLAALCVVAGGFFHRPVATVLAWGFLTILGLELVTLLIGLRIARVPRSAVLSLLFAPVYIVWKLALYPGMALRRTTLRWQRTERT
jgi:1,2-diacylglycerol 3-beta-glucosyltransferase